MRLIFFVNNSTKDFTSPVFIPEDGAKGFLLSRFIFAVILENYCQMKGVSNGGKSINDFIKSDDFKNYALSFLADNFIYCSDFGESIDLIEATKRIHTMKTDFDISSCSSIVSSADLSLLIEQVYQMVSSVVNSVQKEENKDERPEQSG